MLNLSEILKSKYRIQKHVHNTPLMLSETLSNASGASVYVKLESLQKTGAFKIRGIYNRILSSSDLVKSRGFITASSGNHGLGLAYVCREQSLPCTVVVPTYTPSVKVNSIKREGAEIILAGSNWNESYSHATQLSLERSSTLIHPFEDDDVINGQGTIALEILEQFPSPTHFIASIGGGSMIASNSLVMKELAPSTKVLGVQTLGANAMYESIQKGELTELHKISSQVESFATKKVSQKTFDAVKRNVDKIVLLSDEECIESALFMLERSNILLELSAAICVAALLKRKFEYKSSDHIVMVLCGGNYDLIKLAQDILKLRA